MMDKEKIEKHHLFGEFMDHCDKVGLSMFVESQDPTILYTATIYHITKDMMSSTQFNLSDCVVKEITIYVKDFINFIEFKSTELTNKDNLK